MFNWLLSLVENPNIDPITDWFGHFILNNGIFAPIFLLLLDEAGVPLPIPGDIYIAYSGYLIKRGRLSYPEAFIMLLISVLLGSTILYYLSWRYGNIAVQRFGPLVHLDESKLKIVQTQFKKYGILAIIIGRHIPGFRVPVTVFAGMSKITYPTFIISTFISVIFWIAFYLSFGEKVGPRIMHLLHGNYTYLLLFLIPLILVSGTIFLLRVKKEKIKLPLMQK